MSRNTRKLRRKQYANISWKEKWIVFKHNRRKPGCWELFFYGLILNIFGAIMLLMKAQLDKDVIESSIQRRFIEAGISLNSTLTDGEPLVEPNSVIMMFMTMAGRMANVVGTMKMYKAMGRWFSERKRKKFRNTTERLQNGETEAEFMGMKKDLLLVLTIESVVLGVVLGFVIRPFNPSNDTISLIGFPGEIFMQIVEMMILPLIISSVISALAQVRAKDARRIGIVTVIYYMTTTFLSTFTGIILVKSIHPGDPDMIHSLGSGTLENTALSTLDTFLDQIRNMFPENIIQATFQQVQTYYVPKKTWQMQNANGTLLNSTMISQKPQLMYTSEMNVLGLIVFCSGFGVILSVLGDQARLMINFFIVLDAIIMRWISALMWCYPIGILSLVCKNIVDIDNLTETAQALAMYVVTVICGLMIHSLLTLPLLYFMVTRKSPFAYMTGMLQALATAFGTASSSATLPVTFRALEDVLKIDRRVTRFVLPLGATITMDGTALYEAVAVIFIAQLHNIELGLLDLLTISVTTTVASIGSGSVPAGLDTILIVLTTVGLPAKDLSLLLTVDWLLDRIRTSVNVLGDGFGAGIIHHLTKDSLVEADTEELIRQIREDIHILNSPQGGTPFHANGTRSIIEAARLPMQMIDADPTAISVHSVPAVLAAQGATRPGRTSFAPGIEDERKSLLDTTFTV